MRKLIAILIVLVMSISLVACESEANGVDFNYDFIDLKYGFDKAYILMPDGSTLEVDVKKWTDYEGEQIQIIAEDGSVYLTSSFNCILVNEGGRE